MKQVQCNHVFHSYDGVRNAVHDLSLTIAAGQVLALIGPNGAGKSTTLRMLATLQKPDRGCIEWDGIDAWKHRRRIRPQIGFLGDKTGLYPEMSTADYLRFFAECYGLNRTESTARVDELLAIFDLKNKHNARIENLSKGMRQRLAIARTLIQRPKLLLLDEPADGLDPLGRRHLRQVLRTVANDGVAIVISSHILRELDDFCDAIAILQKGRLKIHATVDEVIQGYEIGRRLYEIQIVRGLQQALAILRTHESLIETIQPLHKSERSADESSADRGLIRTRIHGSDEKVAQLIKELVLANVELSSLATVRSDLEDIYSSLGSDIVS